MTFPTLGTTVESGNDNSTDAGDGYDLLNVTVPSGYQTLLVIVSCLRPTVLATTAFWDTAGVNEALTACGAHQSSASWGGGRIYILANPTAGTNKTVRVNTNTAGGEQIGVCAIPIQESVTQIAYSSQDNNPIPSGTSDVSATVSSIAVGDAIFVLSSDDVGISNGTAAFTSGTQLQQQPTGGGDSYSTEGYQVAASTSETITFHYTDSNTTDSALYLWVVLRNASGGGATLVLLGQACL